MPRLQEDNKVINLNARIGMKDDMRIFT